ncbi:MAG: trypsin-like serine protease [Anaerolineales bacterium]|nr:trypsin-like serine protease [Anaerolineales bacterium]
MKHNDAYAILTAGHCIDLLGISTGDPVYHNSTQIGTYSGFHKWGTLIPNGTGIDAAILYMNDFWTAYDDVNYYSDYRDIGGSTSTYVTGYWRCWTGNNSGTRCGELNCTSTTFFHQAGGLYYTDVFTIDPTGIEGDSGGPAYRPLTNQTVDVTGIKSGSVTLSCTNGEDSFFSKWHIVQDWWNLSLIAGDAYLPLIQK